MRIRPLLAVVAGLCLHPAASQAAPCDGFSDVDSANATYCSAVAFIKDKGVTLGCSDASHYCPNDYVTRLQMALFMQRLARGGSNNVLPDATSSVGGGSNNQILGTQYFASIGGGSDNKAYKYATVAGGTFNHAEGLAATVGGGASNEASGDLSAVPGGQGNVASGTSSFAAGILAHADQLRCAVFSLWDTPQGMNCIGVETIFRIGANHGFSVDYFEQRPSDASGGGQRWVTISDVFPGQTISTWTGAYLTDGGTWTNASDRNAKTDIVPVDPLTVLDKVAAMPVSTWRYNTQVDELHLGPMAQDFRAAFGLGADDRHIATVDEGGVALAAIKGLNAKVEARDARIAELESGNSELRRRLDALEKRLDR